MSNKQALIKTKFLRNGEVVETENEVIELSEAPEIFKELLSIAGAKTNYDLQLEGGLISGKIIFYCTDGSTRELIIETEKI